MKTSFVRFHPVASRFLLVVLGLAVTGPAAYAEKMVAVRSSVDPLYAARRAAKNPPPVETYAFIRGKYFNQIPMDRYLEGMSFQTIGAVLAADLKQQNYVPAKSAMDADLMLLIHWGVTMATETNAAQFAQDPDGLRVATEVFQAAKEEFENPTDTTSLEVAKIRENNFTDSAAGLRLETSNVAGMYISGASTGETNAELLGFQNSLYEEDKSPFTTSLAETIRLMMNEERYFIIVMAYDGPALRDGRKKRLWTTRMSIRAAGVNFAIAVDRLSGAGADYFGRRQDDIAMPVSKDRYRLDVTPGKVEIGPMIVVGEATPPPAQKSQTKTR